MSKIAVVYWSGTGNTEAMAKAVLEGAKEKGAEVVLLTPDEFDVSMMDSYDAIAFGCRQGICFIPVILIFPFIWGLNGILYAQPIADVLSALITVFMAIPLHKSLTVAEQKMKTTSIPCDRQ